MFYVWPIHFLYTTFYFRYQSFLFLSTLSTTITYSNTGPLNLWQPNAHAPHLRICFYQLYNLKISQAYYWLTSIYKQWLYCELFHLIYDQNSLIFDLFFLLFNFLFKTKVLFLQVLQFTSHVLLSINLFRIVRENVGMSSACWCFSSLFRHIV